MSCNTEREYKYIYVVLASTPYKTGKVIRAVKNVKYNHASISLEPTLEPMYAFSRRYERSTFNAGFVEESLLRYQSKKDDAEIMVARLPVTEEQYNKAKTLLEEINNEKEEYIYNFFSAAATAVYGGYVEVDRSYTCIEFVCYILREIGVYKSKNPSPTLDALERVLKKYTVYEGKSENYHKAENWGGDEFPQYQTRYEYAKSHVNLMRTLTNRYRNNKK